MPKYHLSNEGQPAPCSAQTPERCPLKSVAGGEVPHFEGTKKDAREWAEQQNAEKAAEESQRESSAELAGIQRYIRENASTQEEADKLLKQHKKMGNSAFIIKHGVQVHGLPDAVEYDESTDDDTGDDVDGENTGAVDEDTEISDVRRNLKPLKLDSFVTEEGLGRFNDHFELDIETSEDLIETTDEVVEEDEDLGIVSYKNTGLLAESRYFAPTTIRGKINRQELVDNSEAYKKLGFDDLENGGELILNGVTDYRRGTTARSEYMRHQEMRVMSHLEYSSDGSVEVLHDEQKAIFDYTTSGYETINHALYSGERGPVAERLKPLDFALKKAPKRQRKLFRFMESTPSIARGLHGTVSEWAAETFTTGQEIKFDAYQSSSNRPAANSTDFLRHRGVVFEIVTSEGMNITHSSSYPNECEVLLPRNSRYVVADVKKDVDAKIPHTPEDTENREGDTYEGVTVVRLIAVNDDGEVKDGSN